MNYSELQLIWDEQNERTLFAFDEEALERVVREESNRSRLNLRTVEKGASILLVGLASVIGVETYLQGEYFQIGSISIMLVLSAVIYGYSRKAEARLQAFGSDLIGQIDRGIFRTKRVIMLLRNIFIGFCCYLVFGTIVRSIVYDLFAHSEVKLAATLVAPILLYLCFRWEVKKVHRKRLETLEVLRSKLSAVH